MYKNFQIEIRARNKCLKPVKMYISIIKSRRKKNKKIPQRQKKKKKNGLTKKLECIMEVWQHLIKVIIIYWNAEEVTLLYKWRLLTCGCDIQNIGYAINLK